MKKQLRILLDRYPCLTPCEGDIMAAYTLLADCFRQGGKLLVCGNGGSAADAQHIVGELMKDFVLPRRVPADHAAALRAAAGDRAELLISSLRGALPAIALTGEDALETAYANDAVPQVGFAQQVYGYGAPGDVLLAITTSGNSENVLLAAAVAESRDMKVIGLTGETGGKLKKTADVTITVPGRETYQIQELHLPVYHALCLGLEECFFGEQPSPCFMGVDIGGTKSAVVLAAPRGKGEKPVILGKRKIRTEGAPEEMLEKLSILAGELLREHPDPVLQGIGIACGGPLDATGGIVLSPPNLPGWDGIPVTRYFTERFGVPAVLGNDADASALAEWKFGAGAGCRNMIFLTFGTGLGAGLILDGKLYSGTGGNAGEIGHVRLRPEGPVGYGKAGSAEGFCSGGGIARLAALRCREDPASAPLLSAVGGDPSAFTAKRIGDMAEEGDPFCRRVYAECGRMLGETLSILTDLFDPERIILGGVFMRSEGLLRESMEAVMAKEALSPSLSRVRILPAGLGEAIGDFAALALIMT